MKKLIIIVLFIAAAAVGVILAFVYTKDDASVSQETSTEAETQTEQESSDVEAEEEGDIVEEMEETAQAPKEEVREVTCEVPVSNDDLTLYSSEDGLAFTKERLLFSRASVPNLFWDAAAGDFILSFQSFANASNLCDRMAYVRLALDGSVSEAQPLLVQSSTYFNGFDPTIVAVHDEPVLVYTVRPPGKTKPCITLATTKGDDVSAGFVNLEQILWCSSGDSENYMDASAVVVGDALYLYVPSDAAMASSSPASYFAEIDISSDDPDDWKMTQTGKITDAELFLLGEVVGQSGDASCPYAFYGTYQSAVWRECSSDGLSFGSSASSVLSKAADPGVAKKPDGSYYLVVTQ